jgi:cyclin-dependent kinase
MKYTVIKQLHDANDGPVYLVRMKNGKVLVLKKYRYSPTETIKNSLVTEMMILSNMKGYSNLLQLDHINNDIGEYDIFVEALEGELHELIKKKPNKNLIKRYMRDILTGLFNLHQFGIIHNDLRPSNIMFDKTKTLKIIDFGNCYFIQFPYNYISHIDMLENYTPPEYGSHRNIGRVSVNSDVYSAGVIFYDMINPKSYVTRHRSQYLSNFIFDPHIINWKNVTNIVGKDGCDLLKQMLEMDPDKRITSMDALKHPYFNKMSGGSDRIWQVPRLMSYDEWLNPTNGDKFLPLIIKNADRYQLKYKKKIIHHKINKQVLKQLMAVFLNSELQFITLKYTFALIYLYLNTIHPKTQLNWNLLTDTCLNLSININEYRSFDFIEKTPELIELETQILQSQHYSLPLPLMITNDAKVYLSFLNKIYKSKETGHKYHDYFLLQLKKSLDMI